MISVSFFIKKSKTNKKGTVPINVKIYRSEEDQATIYTKIRILPDDWDGHQVLPTDPQCVHYNSILSKIQSDVLVHVRDHMEEPASTIKFFYLDSFKKKYSVGDLLKEFIEMKLAEKSMTNKDTIRTYKTHHKALNFYLKSTQLFHYDAGQFAFPEGRMLYNKILNDGKSNIYSNKLLRKMKSAIEWGVGERMIKSDHLRGLKLKSIPHKSITSEDYLNLGEVVRIISVDCPNKYNRAKAMATVQIFSGQAFVDTSDKNPDKIRMIRDKKVMVATRSKTKGEYIVPLDRIALAVLESYEWTSCKKLTNHTYNKHLKVLAAYAGINKNVSTHTLRRTFAQNSLDGGLSAEVVAKMLGHKDTRMIKFYATISSTRILDEYESKMAA